MQRIPVLSALATSLLTLGVLADTPEPLQLYYVGYYQQAQQAIAQITDKKQRGEALYQLAQMQLRGLGMPRDDAKGMTTMQESADAGYALANLYLGQHHLHNQDLKKAIPYIQAAAKGGIAKAEFLMGIAYLKGLGVRKNPHKARMEFIPLAKEGNTEAQRYLGLAFLDSKHKSDRRMGEIWLKKAAQNNNAAAQYYLAQELMKDTKNKKAQAEAKRWLEKAKQAKYPAAMPQVASADDQTDAQNATLTVDKADDKADNKKVEMTDQQKLQTLLQLAKESGQQYRNPTVARAKPGQALAVKPIDELSKGDVFTQTQILSSKDIPIAYFYKKAFSNPTVNSKLEMPIDRFTLPVGANNPQEAFNQLKRNAEYGHAQSMYKLAQMYEQGIGTTKDMAKAKQLFDQAAQQGISPAEYANARIIYNEEGQAALNRLEPILQRAALKGNGNAQFALAQIYADEKPDYAIGLYNLAAQNGEPKSQLRLASIYASGNANPSSNAILAKEQHAAAKKLLVAAVQKRIPEAELPLAYYLAGDPHSTPQQQQQAFKIAEKYQEDPRGQFLLGLCYEHGIGTKQDPGEAADYFYRLAERGDRDGALLAGYKALAEKDNQRAKQLFATAGDAAYAKYGLALADYQTHPDQALLVNRLADASLQGFAPAQLQRADILLSSDDKAQQREATMLYQRFGKDDKQAALRLGHLYEKGIYYSPEAKKAAEWYRQAAKGGSAAGQYAYGALLLRGDGVERKPALAKQWFTTAGKLGYQPALAALKFMQNNQEN